MNDSKNKRKGKRLIFRASRKTHSGKVLYARDYGLKAWKIWI